MAETLRDRAIRLIAEMQARNTDRGCTPAEAAAFAAKISALMEKYQIDEIELQNKEPTPETVEVCQEYYYTDKRVHNHGVTQMVAQISSGMACKPILLHKQDGPFRKAGYGIVGETIDAHLVVQLVKHLVPKLRAMGAEEGRENGYVKAELIKWNNQYLTGASFEIEKRLMDERNKRSVLQQNANSSTALVVTGNQLFAIKQEASAKEFRRLYPRTKRTQSRAGRDDTAFSAGREAGKRVGLGLPVKGNQGQKRIG